MTSSGFADGLGRRTLAFDREEGVMLERLVLRPELGAFESMLRDRLDSLGTLEDERIARPRTIERDVDGALVVVSEFVPGSRLAELLDTAAETGTAPGMDAALGFLLDLLPALCGLHAGARFAHGSISPSHTSRTTPASLSGYSSSASGRPSTSMTAASAACARSVSTWRRRAGRRGDVAMANSVQSLRRP